MREKPKLKTKCCTYTFSVSKGCIEGMCVWEKQVLDVCEAFDLELLRLFFYDLSNERLQRKDDRLHL